MGPLNKNILIVDTDLENAEQIKNLLDNTDYNIVAISNSFDNAQRLLKKEKIDLILLDHDIRERIETTDNHYELDILDNYPTLNLTASSELYFFHLDQCSFLLKPVDKAILIPFIEITLFKHEKQQELLERELNYKCLLDNNESSILIVNNQGQLLDINKNASSMLAIDRSKVKNHYIDIFFNNIAQYIHIKEQLHKHGSIKDYAVELLVKKQIIPVMLTAFNIMDKENHVLCSQFYIKKQSSLSTAVNKSNENIKGKNTMPNNSFFDNFIDPTINKYAELSVNSNIISKIKEYLDNIELIVNKTRQLTNHVLNFNENKNQKSGLELIHVNSYLQEMKNVIEILIGDRYSITYTLSDFDEKISIARKLLEQVIFNLLLNAKEASKIGGNITITTERELIKSQTPGMNLGEYIVISIRDEGIGIETEHLDKIFNPFFTTKPQAIMTGLGLPVANTIMKQAGGFINVETKPGHGSRFSLYFPVHIPEDHKKKLKVSHVFKDIFKGKTALIIENEEKELKQYIEILEYAGFTVLSSSNAIKAIETAEQYKEKIDLLFCNAILKNLSGRITANNICNMHPETSVLFTSCYPKIILIKFRIFDDDVNIINKPFTDVELINMINMTVKK